MKKLPRIVKELRSELKPPKRFPCLKDCFACCTAIKFLPAEKYAMDKLLRKKGISAPPAGKGKEYCEYLDADGRCSVYEERPIICRAFGVCRSPLLICRKIGQGDFQINDPVKLPKYSILTDLSGNNAGDSIANKPVEEWDSESLRMTAGQFAYNVLEKNMTEEEGFKRIRFIEDILQKRGESLIPTP